MAVHRWIVQNQPAARFAIERDINLMVNGQFNEMFLHERTGDKFSLPSSLNVYSEEHYV